MCREAATEDINFIPKNSRPHVLSFESHAMQAFYCDGASSKTYVKVDKNPMLNAIIQMILQESDCKDSCRDRMQQQEKCKFQNMKEYAPATKRLTEYNSSLRISLSLNPPLTDLSQ